MWFRVSYCRLRQHDSLILFFIRLLEGIFLFSVDTLLSVDALTTCSLLFALCSLLVARCSLLFSRCSLLFALCSLLFACLNNCGWLASSWRKGSIAPASMISSLPLFLCRAAGILCGDAGTECTVQDECDANGACIDNGFRYGHCLHSAPNWRSLCPLLFGALCALYSLLFALYPLFVSVSSFSSLFLLYSLSSLGRESVTTHIY